MFNSDISITFQAVIYVCCLMNYHVLLKVSLKRCSQFVYVIRCSPKLIMFQWQNISMIDQDNYVIIHNTMSMTLYKGLIS